jgi:sigma-B regulation protein RsbU (phosphoserine phosphatase)
VAVQNARLFQKQRQENDRMSREVAEARSIQQALLPKSSPYVPGFNVTGLCIPAGAVGGDWYDFIPLDEQRWGLVLADVSGKGTAAALLMSATRAMLRSLAESCSNPGDVLGRLNRLLVEDFPVGRFVTMLYAVLDAEHRTVTFANAGHLRPLLVDSYGARFLETETGMPLGLGFGPYSEVTVHLPEKARLVFYSDGITEAEGTEEEEYGAQRLQAHVVQQRASAESILEDVRSFANGTGLADDATVIFVQA